MSDARVRCQGEADGRPCEAPAELVRESGYCYSHDPETRAALRAGQKLGGARTALKFRRGIDPDELGKLETVEDAIRWCGTIGRAVAQGRLSASAGTTLRQLVAQFLEAQEHGAVRDRVDALAAEVARGRVRSVR